MSAPIELIVAAFADEARADAALKQLKELQRDDVVSIVNAAVMVKTKDGRASIKETEDVRAPAGAVFGAIVGGLVGLLGGPAGAIVGAAAGAATGGLAAHEMDMGFDNQELKEIQENLPAGSSAIIALVALDWVEQVVKTLEELDARLWRQALKENVLASPGAPQVIQGKAASTTAPSQEPESSTAGATASTTAQDAGRG